MAKPRRAGRARSPRPVRTARRVVVPDRPVSSGRPGDALLETIGNTPLLALSRSSLTWPAGVEIYLKAEWLNPGGSVKDRPVRQIILDAERDGRLTRDRTILDSSSGNAGIAYAMIGA